MTTTELISKIREHINSDNRGGCDYFIVDKIEELINEYERDSKYLVDRQSVIDTVYSVLSGSFDGELYCMADQVVDAILNLPVQLNEHEESGSCGKYNDRSGPYGKLIDRNKAIVQLSQIKKLGDDEWMLAVERCIQILHDAPSEPKKNGDWVKITDVLETYSNLYWMDERLLNFKKELNEVYDMINQLPTIELEHK